MKLKELVEAIKAELGQAGMSPGGAMVSLAFVAKRGSDGSVDCDFVDASSLSKPRDNEIHRLELRLEETGGPSGSPAPPKARERGTEIPSKRRKKPLPYRKPGEDGLFVGMEKAELDTPAIYRSRSPAATTV